MPMTTTTMTLILFSLLTASSGCVLTSASTRTAIAAQERTTAVRNGVVNSYHKTAVQWRRHIFLKKLEVVTGMPSPQLAGWIDDYLADMNTLNALYFQDQLARLHNASVVTTYLDAQEGLYEKLAHKTAADQGPRHSSKDVVLGELETLVVQPQIPGVLQNATAGTTVGTTLSKPAPQEDYPPEEASNGHLPESEVGPGGY